VKSAIFVVEQKLV